ncbi:hypothetical protein AB8Z38_16055 [Bradyrhizobium sp. LLZ17]|uniref:Uncharacterized protein n=1 Tax=Bradyrhizobium sp. LLZ17 TaxID=3239388 RepID=A0AB39XSD7_9BRAD
MKHFLPLVLVAAVFSHADARAMLRDASIEHDLSRVRKTFEAITLSQSGQAADLRTARAVVRDAETPPR